MNTDELRDKIWDYLYQAPESKSVDELAAFARQEPQAISAAIDHEWFNVTHNKVSIAYAKGTHDTGPKRYAHG